MGILDISEEQIPFGAELDLVVLVWVGRSCGDKELEDILSEKIGIASFECGYDIGIDHSSIDVKEFIVVAKGDDCGG